VALFSQEWSLRASPNLASPNLPSPNLPSPNLIEISWHDIFLNSICKRAKLQFNLCTGISCRIGFSLFLDCNSGYRHPERITSAKKICSPLDPASIHHRETKYIHSFVHPFTDLTELARQLSGRWHWTAELPVVSWRPNSPAIFPESTCMPTIQ
jgi:hypothetical protein